MSKDKFALGKKGVVKQNCDSIFTHAVYSKCPHINEQCVLLCIFPLFKPLKLLKFKRACGCTVYPVFSFILGCGSKSVH